MASAKVTPVHIWLQGFPCVESYKMFDHYYAMQEIKTDPPAWYRPKTKYEVIEEALKSRCGLPSAVAHSHEGTHVRVTCSRAVACWPGRQSW